MGWLLPLMAQPGHAGHRPAGPLTGVVRPFQAFCVLSRSVARSQPVGLGFGNPVAGYPGDALQRIGCLEPSMPSTLQAECQLSGTAASAAASVGETVTTALSGFFFCT
jgi:hypothetical protein